MKNVKSKIVAFLAPLLLAAPAVAFTDCVGTVGMVFVDSPGTSSAAYYVIIDSTPGTSGVGFYFPAADTNVITDSGIKGTFGLAQLAMTTGKTVTARFSASGVACATFAWRNDLIDFYNLGGR